MIAKGFRICWMSGATARATIGPGGSRWRRSSSKGHGYFATLVFSARLMELRPSSRDAAVSLLSLFPTGAEQEEAWITLRDDCAASVDDVRALGRLRDHLPREVARAVLLAPDKLHDYLLYSIKSVEDRHSDYAMQMQTVCRSNRPVFQEAVDELPADKQAWLKSRVFNPATCRAIALPEQ